MFICIANSNHLTYINRTSKTLPFQRQKKPVRSIIQPAFEIKSTELVAVSLRIYHFDILPHQAMME